MSAKKTEDEIRVYVDTNFIIDCTEGRNSKSVTLMEHIRQNNIPCFSSAFTLLEIADAKKDSVFVYNKIQNHWSVNRILRERYKKDLSDDELGQVGEYIENKVLKTYNFIQFISMTDEAWKLTLRLSANTNISAQDIIHFASAWNAQCFVFITSDDHFYKCIKKILDENPEVNMDVRKPADLLKELFDKK